MGHQQVSQLLSQNKTSEITAIQLFHH